jgi:hypothetical protein
MIATALRTIARGLVVLGSVALIAAVVLPAGLSGYVFLGLALLVLAFLMTLSRTYILRASMPAQGGLFEYKTHPVAYHVGFVVAVVLFGFVLVVLIRAYMGGHGLL